ncbi:transcriptional regulator [Photorhabdus sp. S15-56]|nr:transcriptional regulator [Photorhabdus sp. S7-51]RAW73526.1 transcriptional regulator [Photorhabdus sp. S14-60]RAW78460.1 transcriptional regulator [Photorhabdus sp. S15-56]HEN3291932.1 TraR/DksA C4-type zinc finger protein [Yersinia enterocolitica]
MDDIDRDSDIYELMLTIQIERVRLSVSNESSSHLCIECNAPIPAKRRQILPGVSLCIECQTLREVSR